MYSVSKSESKSYHAHPSGYTTVQESGLCITMAEERDAALLYTDGRLQGAKSFGPFAKRDDGEDI